MIWVESKEERGKEFKEEKFGDLFLEMIHKRDESTINEIQK